MPDVQKIAPFLWFDTQMEEAVRFYVSIFPDSGIRSINPMTASFVLAGQGFMALNGGPMFRFNEAVSFFVKCVDQAEVDRYWSLFLEGGGQAGRCGWLKDKWGVSWQIIPDALGRLMADQDRAKSQRVVQAMMTMSRIVVADLEAAAA